MAAIGTVQKKQTVFKRTKQGGNPKTSTMSKTEKRGYKKYRGQGR